MKNDQEIDRAAAKVVEHLELSGVGFTQKPPVKAHSTSDVSGSPQN